MQINVISQQTDTYKYNLSLRSKDIWNYGLQ